VFFLDGAYSMQDVLPELKKSNGEMFSYKEYVEKHAAKTTAYVEAQYNRTAKLAYASGEIKTDAQAAVNEYEEAPASEKPKLKSKAQVAVFDETGYVSTDFWVENLQGTTKYLDDVVKSILDARNILKKGKVKPEQVVKAYMITLGSMGSGGTYYDNWKEKTGQEVSDIFLEKQKGRDWLRPEGAAAAYLVTDEGKTLIGDMIAGSAKVEQVKKLFDFVGVGRETQKAAYAIKSMENGGIKAMTDTFNENKGKDFAQLYQAAMDNLEGIGEGKTGFFNQYFGVSGRAVIDARELNAWIAGSMKLTPEQVKAKEKAQSSKAIGDMLLNRIEEVGLKLGYSPDMAGYIAHHAIWDGIVGSVTKHAGEYAVVSGKPALKSKAQILGLTGAASLDNAEKVMGNLEVAKKMKQELGKQPLTPGKSKDDARKIKMATGWERGSDDLWRLEIPDATLKDFEVSDLPKYMASQTRYAKLGDIIDAPELFKAYSVPRGEGKQALKDVVVEFLDTDDFRGAFTEKTQKIQISTNENLHKSPQEMLSTMLHEIQHYIQFVEGFETGSTDASMSNIPVVEVQIRRRAKALFNTYNQLVEESKQPGANMSSIKDELQVIKSQYSRLKEEIAKPAKELYKRAAGEVEARNVQRRMGLTNEERRGMLLLETEDVRRADQLLLSDAIQTTNLKSKAQMADLKPGEEVTLKDGNKVVPTSISGQTKFFHASSKKRDGRLRANEAPQWGKAIYFATSRQAATDEFGGDNVTEAGLNLKNPVYTNTKEFKGVDKKAVELYNKAMLPKILKEEAELVNGNWKFFDEDLQAEYDKNGYIDKYSSSDIEEGKYFGQAAKELGHDAIIDEGGQYGTEIAVLDENAVIYPEDIESAVVLSSEDVKNSNIELKKQSIRGRLLNNQQAIELQAEIESNYTTAINMFDRSKDDIRQKMYSYDEPYFEKNINGINVRIAEGLIRTDKNGKREKTYLIYADGNVAGEFYSKNDAIAVVNYIEDNLIKVLEPATSKSQLSLKSKAQVDVSQTISDGDVISVTTYNEKAKKLAHAVKDGDADAIDMMAKEMAAMVPANAVLIPMPSRSGRATNMKDLAEAISKITGAPVADVLTGKKRKSLYEAKKKGETISADDLKMQLIGKLPNGKVPVIVDNVLATGATFKAAKEAIPGAKIIVHSVDQLAQPTLKSKAQMVDNNAKQVADLYAEMREGGGWVERQKINAILDQDPKLSYIYNNFKAITQMLEDAELLTKSGNCP